MRLRLIIGCLLLALLSSCQEAPPVKLVERPIATVALSTPAPAPEQIVEAEKEAPEPPQNMPGPARISEHDNPPAPIAPQIEKPESQPAEPTYPKAKPRRTPFTPSFQVAARPYLPPPRRQAQMPKLPNYPRTFAPRPLPSLPQSYVPRPSALPPAPSYPQRTGAGVYRSNGYQPARPYRPQLNPMARQRERKRLQQQYMQARADALNIKYHRGKKRFSAHSPQVAISAMAPSVPRPGPRAPWDKLGHAFDRSEQARQQLRNFERSRFRPPMPRSPGPSMPGPFRSCP